MDQQDSRITYSSTQQIIQENEKKNKKVSDIQNYKDSKSAVQKAGHT